MFHQALCGCKTWENITHLCTDCLEKSEIIYLRTIFVGYLFWLFWFCRSCSCTSQIKRSFHLCKTNLAAADLFGRIYWKTNDKEQIWIKNKLNSFLLFGHLSANSESSKRVNTSILKWGPVEMLRTTNITCSLNRLSLVKQRVILTRFDEQMIQSGLLSS